MCQQLADLARYVQTNTTSASVSDAIRIACGSCDRTEVCVTVNVHEFELRESQDEESSPPLTARET